MDTTLQNNDRDNSAGHVGLKIQLTTGHEEYATLTVMDGSSYLYSFKSKSDMYNRKKRS